MATHYFPVRGCQMGPPQARWQPSPANAKPHSPSSHGRCVIIHNPCREWDHDGRSAPADSAGESPDQSPDSGLTTSASFSIPTDQGTLTGHTTCPQVDPQTRHYQCLPNNSPIHTRLPMSKTPLTPERPHSHHPLCPPPNLDLLTHLELLIVILSNITSLVHAKNMFQSRHVQLNQNILNKWDKSTFISWKHLY
jgi:hypothetical protein